MRKILSIILVSVMVLFAACSTQTTTEPAKENELENTNNKVITLERSGMYTLPEFAVIKITIDKSGAKTQYFHYNGTFTKEEFLTFENNEFETLVKIFENNNFNTLNEKYNSEVPIADIGQGVITYNEKTITINPYIGNGNPNEISNLIKAIDEILYGPMEEFPPIEPNENENTNQNLISLSYQGMQCEPTPWDVWYSQGNINYIKEPTKEELINDYYANKHSIQIEKVEQVYTDKIVCQACNICPNSYFFQIDLNENQNTEILISEGWEISQ